jgi:NADH:ubiquinone oxidoreductase subunit 5 (subunit L)/multisubunit Na+/H+ antiporter MnhA subunit
LGRPDWIALGLGGAFLHVWNHSLFKPLLFFAGGSVVHAAQTREIDQLGGLARRMPHTASLFGLGAMAICALPPLNGFISELLIYVGLFKTLGRGAGPNWPWAAFAAPVLAMIGGLAILCFVRAYGMVFLGSPRAQGAAASRETDNLMLGAMRVLAVGCLVVGLAPGLVLSPVQEAVTAWAGHNRDASIALADLIPTRWISAIGVLLAALVTIGVAAYERTARTRPAGTWDCGYAESAPRIQYTASSFGQILVGLFRWALWPQRHLPRVTGRFPGGSHFKSHVPDVILDRGVVPAFRLAATVLPWIRFLQQGKSQVYVLYILAILIVLLLLG